MSKPFIHAKNSARLFGGTWEDYFPIHDLLDSSKGALADNRHRALTHNSWFLSNIIEKIYMPEKGWNGPVLTRPSDGKQISTREIAEQHVQEDFRGRFIPTAADYLQDIPIQNWHNNGAGGDVPRSFETIAGQMRTARQERDTKLD
jgi:hypothetical protein